MQVLQPPAVFDQANEPDDVLFARVREEVLRHGITEAVQALREETRSRLVYLQDSWPSDWTYF